MMIERTPGHSTRGSIAPLGLRREPVHVAMRAGIEEFAEIFAGVADRVRDR